MADSLMQTTDHEEGLLVPPLDNDYFSQQLIADGADAAAEDLDIEFCLDDLWIPSAEELDDLLNPVTGIGFDGNEPASNSNHPQFAPIFDQHQTVFKSNASELRHFSEIENLSGDCNGNGSEVLNSASSGSESNQVSGYLNVPSPETDGSNKVLNCSSPESLVSGSCGSNVAQRLNNHVSRSVPSSPDLNNSSTSVGVDQTIKLEESSRNKSCCSLLKRKKYCEDLMDTNMESRINKVSCVDSVNLHNNNNNTVVTEEEKRNARLMRNRESAQLSRQRKKYYIGELEEKVKMMSSTIQDLNAKISYFMAENATLRQQMTGASGGGVATPMSIPPPGMYPPPSMVYPWMPYPPYMMRSQGSQVPLVPIPKLKSQRQAQAPKTATKKPEIKKNEGRKTKKVAGISFLGLLFFILLFGGLAPFVNMRYGGVRETLTGDESYVGGGIYSEHHGRVLVANGTGFSNRGDLVCKSSVHCSRSCNCGGIPSDDEFVQLRNTSEPLVASLYVPRNDKLVKIDGNLIIHSILASEKAVSSARGSSETGLAIPGDLGAGIPVPSIGSNGARQPHLRALGSSSTDKESRNPKATDGRLQQWFHEGFAGPMLSSGMCTEVFQFDVSSAIVPSATTRNNSQVKNRNTSRLNKGTNRRILRSLPIPLPESAHNITRQHTDRNPQKENLTGNRSISPLIVSVLMDPREAADADVDGVMGPKQPLSRIFVVVLIDSVRYVTYSCMLPFKGAAMQHLVTS